MRSHISSLSVSGLFHLALYPPGASRLWPMATLFLSQGYVMFLECPARVLRYTRAHRLLTHQRGWSYLITSQRNKTKAKPEPRSLAAQDHWRSFVTRRGWVRVPPGIVTSPQGPGLGWQVIGETVLFLCCSFRVWGADPFHLPEAMASRAGLTRPSSVCPAKPKA